MREWLYAALPSHGFITITLQSEVPDEEDGEVVNGLFLSVLNRFPTEVEKQTSVEAIRSADSRLEGAQDVVWALLNSPSFLFNH